MVAVIKLSEVGCVPHTTDSPAVTKEQFPTHGETPAYRSSFLWSEYTSSCTFLCSHKFTRIQLGSRSTCPDCQECQLKMQLFPPTSHLCSPGHYQDWSSHFHFLVIHTALKTRDCGPVSKVASTSPWQPYIQPWRLSLKWNLSSTLLP